MGVVVVDDMLCAGGVLVLLRNLVLSESCRRVSENKSSWLQRQTVWFSNVFWIQSHLSS